ncbi:MAG TPA: hypothetical protein VN954_04610 [Ktedonobacteraceae bacterium]|nr:hypothetical protein [Ktedonobacteraceae bacterium]
MVLPHIEGFEIAGNGRRWHLPALPMRLARLLQSSQASRKEKRPHPSSQQPPPLRGRTPKPWFEGEPANVII